MSKDGGVGGGWGDSRSLSLSFSAQKCLADVVATMQCNTASESPELAQWTHASPVISLKSDISRSLLIVKTKDFLPASLFDLLNAEKLCISSG
jgi:hypothetical protein